MLFPDGLSGPIGETPFDYFSPFGIIGFTPLLTIDMLRGKRDVKDVLLRNAGLGWSASKVLNPNPVKKVGGVMSLTVNLLAPYKPVEQPVETSSIDDPDYLIPRGMLQAWIHSQISPGWKGHVPPQKVIKNPAGSPSSQGIFDLCPPGEHLINGECVKR